ncbi:primosomal protein [Caulobacter sp. LARHSG274]
MAPETEFDDQDGAEVLDETNLTDDGQDIANFDEIDDVYDATRANGDDEEDEDAEYDDDLDDQDLDDISEDLQGERDDEGLDIEREPLSPVTGDEEDIEAAISDDDADTADFESTQLADDDIEVLGYAKDR